MGGSGKASKCGKRKKKKRQKRCFASLDTDSCSALKYHQIMIQNVLIGGLFPPSLLAKVVGMQVRELHPIYETLSQKLKTCLTHGRCTSRTLSHGSRTTKSLLGALQIFSGCTCIYVLLQQSFHENS